MINLSRLFGRFDKRKQVDFADDSHTQLDRGEIDEFLSRVLPEEEREHIDTYFISDEASIFDCSLSAPESLQANVKTAYGVSLGIEELKLPLYVLVDHVKALRP